MDQIRTLLYYIYDDFVVVTWFLLNNIFEMFFGNFKYTNNNIVFGCILGGIIF